MCSTRHLDICAMFWLQLEQSSPGRRIVLGAMCRWCTKGCTHWRWNPVKNKLRAPDCPCHYAQVDAIAIRRMWRRRRWWRKYYRAQAIIALEPRLGTDVATYAAPFICGNQTYATTISLSVRRKGASNLGRQPRPAALDEVALAPCPDLGPPGQSLQERQRRQLGKVSDLEFHQWHFSNYRLTTHLTAAASCHLPSLWHVTTASRGAGRVS